MRKIDRRQQGQASIWITVILLLTATYFIFTYLPPWYKSWKAKNVIGEVISGTNNYDEERLREDIANALTKIGVDVAGDGDVSVEVDQEDKRIQVIVKWPAIITFPFTRKTTKIDFLIKVKRKTG